MFPQLYHTHHNRHLEDLPFWLALASRLGGPILELGCGTGRILVPLARAGYQVFGIDNDPTMLSALRRTVSPDHQLNIHVFLADLVNFSIGRRFPLILLPCNTFSSLSSPSRLATLEQVASHLEPGGLFAVSLPNPALLKSLPRRSEPQIEESFPHPADGEPVQVSSAWKRNNQFVDFVWHYDHLLPDGQVDRLSVRQRQYLFSPETALAEFAAAGLQVAEAYGSFDWSAFTSSSPYLIILSRLSAGF